MKRSPLAVLVLSGIVLVWVTGGAADTPPTQSAATRASSTTSSPLGSEGFNPTPEQTFGWRGDGSGRFPGADPPLEWRRIAKTPLRDLRCQASRPKDDLTPGDVPRLGCSDGFLFDWLALGPVEVADADKAVDEETLPKEAGFRPDEGDKVGDLAWKRVSATDQWWRLHYIARCKELGLGLPTADEIARRVGNNYNNVGVPLFEGTGARAAYAHTYVYSDDAASIQAWVRHGHGGLKVWLNGKAVYGKATPAKDYVSLSLSKGWNAVLVKSTISDAYHPGPDGQWTKGVPGSWFFQLTLCPPAGPVAAYEATNVKWMTRIPSGWDVCFSSPVLAGDKLFVTTGSSDLVCYDRRDGRLLWIRTNTYYDAATAEERQRPEAKKAAELVGQLVKLDEEMVKAINAGPSPASLVEAPNPDFEREVFRGYAARRTEMIKAIDATMSAVDPKRFPKGVYQRWGMHSPTPVTDGKNVCVWFSLILSAGYDVDGNRRWCRVTDARKASGHHGNHSSPVLVDGKFIVSDNAVMAYDVSNGELLWTNKIADPQYSVPALMVTTIAGQKVVLDYEWPTAKSRGFLVQDGTPLWGLTPLSGSGVGLASCIIESNILYRLATSEYYAVKLPTTTAPDDTPQLLKKRTAKDGREFCEYGVFFQGVSSPLYYEGLIYNLSPYGWWRVHDAATHEVVGECALDFRLREGHVVRVGVCASVALAGKRLYAMDNSGLTVVLEPGRVPKASARNLLENLDSADSNARTWYDRTPETLASPIFQGKDMYVRSGDYLYCISKK